MAVSTEQGLMLAPASGNYSGVKSTFFLCFCYALQGTKQHNCLIRITIFNCVMCTVCWAITID